MVDKRVQDRTLNWQQLEVDRDRGYIGYSKKDLNSEGFEARRLGHSFRQIPVRATNLDIPNHTVRFAA
jgi:hypothetical protein